MEPNDIIKPGSVIGMLGDGQLGRMSALAGAHLGYRFAVLGPHGRDSSAGQVAWWAESWGKDYSNEQSIDEFVRLVSENGGVVTYEWENIPVTLIRRLEARGLIVRPGPQILEIAQDRFLEKQCAKECGIETTKFFEISCAHQLDQACCSTAFPAILKTRRDGFDGRGQTRVRSSNELSTAWNVHQQPCVLEEVVDFTCEISIIVARQPGIRDSQNMILHGPIGNRHENGILRESVYPALVPDVVSEKAHNNAIVLADKLDLHGLLAIEFFVTEDRRVLFNEMAPRPHNSGHLTIECSHTSQFEQHIRAVCNLPLGSARFHSNGRMINILGDELSLWEEYIKRDGSVVHVYGKGGPLLERRKMGHVTFAFSS